MVGTNGVIVDGIIAVDMWDPVSLPNSVRFHFLSHCHADHIAGIQNFNAATPIFTSSTNTTILPHVARLNGRSLNLKPLALNEEHVLARDDLGNESLSVVLIDANHVPGAVMFLFSGCLGNILVTGDFRTSQAMFDNQHLSNIVKNQDLDRLYLDNTFLFQDYNFGTRDEVMKKAIKLAGCEADKVIYVGMRKLGKEEALVKLAMELKEKICVDADRFKLYRTLGLPDIFTTDVNASRDEFYQCDVMFST